MQIKNKKGIGFLANPLFIIVVLLIILFYFGLFQTGSLTGTFGNSETNTVRILTFDNSVVNYQVNSYPIRSDGSKTFISRQEGSRLGATDISKLGLGEIIYTSNFQSDDKILCKEYSIKNIKIEGLRALTRTGDDVDSTDYKNIEGFCRPCGSRVTCEIVKGELIAFVDGKQVGKDVVNDFYGVTQISLEFTGEKEATAQSIYSPETNSPTSPSSPTTSTSSSETPQSTESKSFIDKINEWIDNLIQTIKGWFS